MPPKKDAVDNIGRRKWDMVAATKKRQEQIEEEEKELLWNKDKKERALIAAIERVPLKRREQQIDIRAKLNKREMVSSTGALSEQGGYYCATCECLLKDSSTYLSHINGRRHQRRLGMTMRAERATLQEVRDRLQFHKRKREDAEDSIKGVEARLKKYDAALKKKKKKKKKKAKEAEKAAEEELTEEQKAMKAAGFSFAFGGSKKN
mmetsp:Transcript_22398/g.33374  ORF Transcript_22398/g.33374 Transcript_22398/m.33374 type:complete len:206 (-) Transcript_22398:156-773(-)